MNFLKCLELLEFKAWTKITYITKENFNSKENESKIFYILFKLEINVIIYFYNLFMLQRENSKD